MKPLFFFILILWFASSTAQPVIYKCKDDYGGFNFHFVSEKLNCTTPDSTGFIIDPFVNSKGEFKYFTLQSFGMGRCCNACILTFIFTNGRKLSLVGDNAVSCLGFAFFGANRNQVKMLSQYPILSVEFQNGLAGKVHKHIVDASQSNYFIVFFEAISAKKVVQIKPSDL